MLPEDQLQRVKAFFTGKGVKISGGIMAYGGKPNDRVDGILLRESGGARGIPPDRGVHGGRLRRNHFRRPVHIQQPERAGQKAKGDLSWTDYRLKVMKAVGEDLVVKNARSVNPRIHLIIKPPNWYDQYQFRATTWRRSLRFSTWSTPERRPGTATTPRCTCSSTRATTSCGITSTSSRASSAADGWIPARARP